MKPQLYPIHSFGQSAGNGTLSAMAMPDPMALESNLQDLHSSGVDKILCLLEESESDELGLQQQESLAASAGIEFQRFSIVDYGVPDFLDLQILITRTLNELHAGKHVLVHCRGGIGRTGLICCCLVLSTGVSVPDAVALVTDKRGEQVPETPAQIDMLIRYAARNRKA